MGAGCIIPCTLESGCAIASSAVAISAKSYDIYKTRKRSKSLPIVCNKVLLPPINKPRRIRNNTE
jgi:hypothetical protein